MNSINTVILILGLLIGMLFDIGVSDWQILLKDEYKVTDWIIAICTILIVIGTLLAACYAKQSADYARRQLLANNLPIAIQIYDGLVKEFGDFSFKLNDRCREVRNLVFNRYEPTMTLSMVVPNLEKTLNELEVLQKSISAQEKQLYFIMQNNDFGSASRNLYQLKLNLMTFLDLYKYNPNGIKELQHAAKNILEVNDKIIRSLSAVRNFFKHYFEQ